MIKIYLASDHAGVELKSKVLSDLTQGEFLRKYEVIDLGPFSKDSVDYPDYADLVCQKLKGLQLVGDASDLPTNLSELGILICGSGQGMNIRANKYQHIRAALCWNEEIAGLAREHNDANVLCLGARAVSTDVNIQIVHRFLATSFAGGRHRQRVVKISAPV